MKMNNQPERPRSQSPREDKAASPMVNMYEVKKYAQGQDKQVKKGRKQERQQARNSKLGLE